jgi:hypothetical protein
MNYHASSNRYSEMVYRVCGRSGLKLPVMSLGLWHNFGGSGANFKKGRRADPGALGERESLACQIGPKFKLCTRSIRTTMQSGFLATGLSVTAGGTGLKATGGLSVTPRLAHT